MSQNNIKTLWVLLGAARAEVEHVQIAPEYLPQIETALAKLALMSGTEVLNAVIALQRSGLNPSPDLRVLERNSLEYSADLRARSRQPGAMHPK
jgi:hypothetical protein